MACEFSFTDTAFDYQGTYCFNKAGTKVYWTSGFDIMVSPVSSYVPSVWKTGAIDYESYAYGMSPDNDDNLVIFYLDVGVSPRIRIESVSSVIADEVLDLDGRDFTLYAPQSVRYNPADGKIYVANWRYDAGLTQYVFMLSRLDSNLTNQVDLVETTPSTMDADPQGARIAFDNDYNLWVSGEATDGRFFHYDIGGDGLVDGPDGDSISLWTPCGAETCIISIGGNFYSYDKFMNGTLTSECNYSGYQLASQDLSVLGIGSWPYAADIGTPTSAGWGLLACTTATPPLRQKQRDDFYNTPRNRYGPQGGGQPASLQESLRQSWGSNTYLLDRELCGC